MSLSRKEAEKLFNHPTPLVRVGNARLYRDGQGQFTVLITGPIGGDIPTKIARLKVLSLEVFDRFNGHSSECPETVLLRALFLGIREKIDALTEDGLSRGYYARNPRRSVMSAQDRS